MFEFDIVYEKLVKNPDGGYMFQTDEEPENKLSNQISNIMKSNPEYDFDQLMDELKRIGWDDDELNRFAQSVGYQIPKDFIMPKRGGRLALKTAMPQKSPLGPEPIEPVVDPNYKIPIDMKTAAQVKPDPTPDPTPEVKPEIKPQPIYIDNSALANELKKALSQRDYYRTRNDIPKSGAHDKSNRKSSLFGKVLKGAGKTLGKSIKKAYNVLDKSAPTVRYR